MTTGWILHLLKEGNTQHPCPSPFRATFENINRPASSSARSHGTYLGTYAFPINLPRQPRHSFPKVP